METLCHDCGQPLGPITYIYDKHEFCKHCHQLKQERKKMSKPTQVAYDCIPIFVYGTLKAGGGLAPIWTAHRGVFMSTQGIIGGNLIDIGHFPALIPGNRLSHRKGCRGVVSGEIIYPKNQEAAEDLLKKLDRAEGVSQGLYKRIKVVELETRQPCWTYIWGDHEYANYTIVQNCKYKLT